MENLTNCPQGFMPPSMKSQTYSGPAGCRWQDECTSDSRTHHNRDSPHDSMSKQPGCPQVLIPGMYSPSVDIASMLHEFCKVLDEVLGMVPDKYHKIVDKCMSKFEDVRSILLHYEQAGHQGSYFHKMHSNSTEMKENLLSMLKQEQQDRRGLQSDLEHQQMEVKRLNKFIKAKEEAIRDLQLANRKMRKQIQQMEAQLASTRTSMEQKNHSIQGLQADKDQMLKQLNKIESQLGQLNPATIKPKSCIKLGPKPPTPAADQLYHFLAIQALTIESEVIQS